MNTNMNIRQSETKWIDIDIDFDQAFVFLSNPKNWLKCAKTSLRASDTGHNGWNFAESKWGVGELKIAGDLATGTLDQKWKGLKANWTVPTRLLKNGTGTTLQMTLPRFKEMSEVDYKLSLLEWEQDLRQIKNILES